MVFLECFERHFFVDKGRSMKFILITIMCITMIGCVTPYRSKGFMGGYDEIVIGKGKYLVSFEGNGFTSPVSVRLNALRRATELCANTGFNTFRVLDNAHDKDINLMSSGNTVTRYSATLIIQCVNE
jgi:hypothetical protein